ncbi:ABC transporter ATP-binding protein [Cobetia amphilecti]|uniref:ABC transporter ATP-binding protein n=1 Tax=Cobetia amphilecti TaxID=1055104 RepID=A0ABT6UT12_9GAMM|nr:ABC transporter ATP-binding protein [Cobetia amphilecti]MDI5885848.1 ABC transporter ATP-binding protein [Cobetia amphilecti]
MIEIKNLYKRYHNHHGSDWVLRDINLTIPSGVSVGLIGANGAGKSTLLRLIAGMDTPERGEVIRHSRVSWPIGLSGGMQGSMTGRQNVKFVARAQGRGTDVAKIVDFVEDFAEIGKAFDEPVKTYSSGMRSRLSFGLSFAFDFDVYISDEATAVGDRAFKVKAQELFQRRTGQASLIMVSHSEGILRELCQAGIYIRQGEAIWYEDINDAMLDYHVDSDKQSLMPAVAQRASFADLDPMTLTVEKMGELKRSVQQKQNMVQGLWQVILQAKEDGWSQENVEVINQLYRHSKLELDELKSILAKTPQEQRKITKKNLKKVRKALEAIDHSQKLIVLEKTPLNKGAESIFNKAMLMMQEKKLHIELELDMKENK